MNDDKTKKEEIKKDNVDDFFEENWAEGAVQNILDYIEDNGIYIRE